jgi:single-strand DNA-binding protein
MSVNKAILVGNLGKIPRSLHRQRSSRLQVSLATTTAWNDTEGAPERTDWHNIIVWGKQGETAASS